MSAPRETGVAPWILFLNILTPQTGAGIPGPKVRTTMNEVQLGGPHSKFPEGLSVPGQHDTQQVFFKPSYEPWSHSMGAEPSSDK